MKALIVVPAFRESRRIGALLDAVPSCAPQGVEASWLLVDDGSGPSEPAALEKALAERGLSARAAVLALAEHRGKGAALAAGFSRGLAEGFELLAFLDADGSAPPSELGRALELLAARPELSGVIGSRVLMLGRAVRRRALRHYAGRAFATYVSVLFGAPVYDTQCGLKAFRAQAVRRHIGAASDPRWVWDTQLLLAMLDAGEPVVELPIDWTERPGSRLNLLDPLRMAASLLRLRLARRPRGPA